MRSVDFAVFYGLDKLNVLASISPTSQKRICLAMNLVDHYSKSCINRSRFVDFPLYTELILDLLNDLNKNIVLLLVRLVDPYLVIRAKAILTCHRHE